MSQKLLRVCAGTLLYVAFVCPARAQELSQTPTPSPSATPIARAKSEEERLFERLDWRSIGPANMGGRTADVEGVPGNPNVVYVGTGSGGVLKTTNGGNTWRPIFE